MDQQKIERVNARMAHHQTSLEKFEKIFQYHLETNRIKSDDDINELAFVCANAYGIEAEDILAFVREIKAFNNSYNRVITTEEKAYYKTFKETIATFISVTNLTKYFNGRNVVVERVENLEITVQFEGSDTAKSIEDEIIEQNYLLEMEKYTINIYRKGDPSTQYKQLIK